MAVPKKPLASPRVRITETGRILHIVIPARRCWFTIVFTSVWLCGWIVGECLALLGLLTGKGLTASPLLCLLWLIVWTCCGLWQWFVLFWNLRGREVVVVEGETFWIRWAIGRRGYTREFRLAHITDLSPQKYRGLEFCYGGPYFSFGEGASEIELKQIETMIQRRLSPGY